MSNTVQNNAPEKKDLKSVILDSIDELGSTFAAFFKAPKALWGINVPYIIEGLVYFGTLTILGKFSSENINLTDAQAGIVYSFVTGGITFAMLILGGWSDKLGVRKSLFLAFAAMLTGRIFISLSGSVNLGSGLWSPMFWMTMGGLLLVVAAYGLFQPAAYAGVKRYTSKKTSAMGYAVIYGLMNLGAFLSGFVSSFTRHKFENIFPPNGLSAVFWVYAGLTALSLVLTILLITKRSDKAGLKKVEEENARMVASGESEKEEEVEEVKTPKVNSIPGLVYLLFAVGFFLLSGFGIHNSINRFVDLSLFGFTLHLDIAFTLFVIVLLAGSYDYLKRRPWHPFRDKRFTFFIFCLVPVQTLFAHNWLTLPYYLDRAFQGSLVSHYFEVFSNLNPLLIFIITPIIAGLTSKTSIYSMMIWGTTVMAIPTFLLSFGPNTSMFLTYVLFMTIGEAMWSPRFLQWIAEIAPKGKVGLYMGVGQFPWFLDKVITGFYSGKFLEKYCPKGVPVDQLNTGTMWFIYGLIAILTPIGLVLAKKWMLKGMPGETAN